MLEKNDFHIFNEKKKKKIKKGKQMKQKRNVYSFALTHFFWLWDFFK